MKINIPKDIKEKCLKFSYDSVDSSLDAYAKRGQSDKETIRGQIYTGKLGEYVSYLYLKEKYNVTEPDCNIYSKFEKSYAADLLINNKKLHIKSQDINQANKFGMSWIFQFKENSKIHTDNEIFVNKEGTAIFVLVDKLYLTGEIKGIVDINKLHSLNLFKAPKKLDLSSSKKAIYFEDIKNLTFDL